MKILVTGGAGFIGSHVVVALVEAGHEPVIVDNFSNSNASVLGGLRKILGAKPNFYQLDYRDSEKLVGIIQAENIQGIIHFAAFKAVGESVAQPLKYYDNNVAGFISLLQAVEKLSMPIVFSSSCTVYGSPKTLPVTEETPWQPPTSPYGASKQMDEQILRNTTKVSGNLKSIALRYFNPIGAHPSGYIGELPIGTPNNLVPFLTQTVAGIRDRLTVFGNDYDTPDGSCIRDYIHVMDLADAHIQALEYLQEQAPGYCDVFNIGVGKGHSVLEVIKTFEQATGESVAFDIGPRRPGDVPAVYANVDKAHQVLGWRATRSLEKALRDAWHWQQKLR